MVAETTRYKNGASVKFRGHEVMFVRGMEDLEELVHKLVDVIYDEAVQDLDCTVPDSWDVE